jgi:hypothetical protein
MQLKTNQQYEVQRVETDEWSEVGISMKRQRHWMNSSWLRSSAALAEF